MEIRVSYEDTDVKQLLENIIDHPNKQTLVDLLCPLICESYLGADHFIKAVTFNKPLPKVHPPGTIVIVNVDNLSFPSQARSKVYNSDLCIESSPGHIYATIESFRGFHTYTGYMIKHKWLDDKGEVCECSSAIEPKYITLVTEF